MTDRNPTQIERLAILETKFDNLIDKITDYRDEDEQAHSDLKAAQKTMDAKLDELLTLKHKGSGAFALAAALVGTGFMAILTLIIEWWHK